MTQGWTVEKETFMHIQTGRLVRTATGNTSKITLAFTVGGSESVLPARASE